jgi:hypothetical protein
MGYLAFTIAAIFAALILYAIVCGITQKGWVKAAQRFHVEHTESFTQGDRQMERYKAKWSPSPSTFVEQHELIAKINAGAETALLTNIQAPAFEATFTVEQGQQVECWLRTWGDNGTFADTPHVTFTVENKEAVLPVTGFSVAWMEHVA